MRQHFHRPRPLAWFFFLLCFGTCLVLGSWQIKRLVWKNALIESIATANEAAPLATLPEEADALEPLQFRRVVLNGRWVEGVEFHLAPRYWQNQFGYALINPLKLADGRVVLVNRGWIPATKKSSEKRPETAAKGRASITGLVRVGAERSYFTPPNSPEQNIWFGRDVAAMAEAAQLGPVIPVMVDAVGAQESGHLPIPSDGTIRLRNDHLSYVFTWFGIAAGMLVIFLVYHRKKSACDNPEKTR